MRAWLPSIAVALAAPIAHGDPVPFPTIAALCAAACPADVASDQRCECRMLDRVDEAHAAIVLISSDDEYRRRGYGIAVHGVDGWWLGHTVELDATGYMYDPGNCCYSRAVGPIRYSVGSGHVEGFDGPVAVLRVSHAYVRASKPSWPYAPPSPVVHIAEVLICGTRADEPIACLEAHLPKCAGSRFAIAGAHVVTACPGEAWASLELTATP